MICDLRTVRYCFSAGGTLDLIWSVFMAMDATCCQLDMASADLLQLKLELDSCHKVEGERGCCSQDCLC